MANGYLTPTDERRAAAWLIHQLRGDFESAKALTDAGPISAVALLKAVTAVFPETVLNPDAVVERAERHLHMLFDEDEGGARDG